MKIQRVTTYDSKQNTQNRKTSFKALYRTGRVFLDGMCNFSSYTQRDEVHFLEGLLDIFDYNIKKRDLFKRKRLDYTLFFPVEPKEYQNPCNVLLPNPDETTLIEGYESNGLRIFKGDHYESLLVHRPEGPLNSASKGKAILPESFIFFPYTLPQKQRKNRCSDEAFVLAKDQTQNLWNRLKIKYDTYMNDSSK